MPSAVLLSEAPFRLENTGLRNICGGLWESGRYVACILERLTPADRTSAGQYMIHL